MSVLCYMVRQPDPWDDRLMTSDLRAEIEMMRQELAALKSARDREETEKKQTIEKKANDTTSEEHRDLPSDVKQALEEIVAEGQKEWAERPLMAMGLAFLAGLVLGRAGR